VRGPLCPLVVGVLTCVLGGCRLGDPPAPAPFDEVIAADEVLASRASSPLPFRVAVAPLQVTFEPHDLYPGDDSRHGSLPDPERFRAELCESLERSGVFERVSSRGSYESSPDDVKRVAWNLLDDLLLELELRSYHQEYLGRANYLTWFVLYWAAVWPAWYVTTDTFGQGLEVHVTLRGTQGVQPPLLDRTYVIDPQEASLDLTPFDRELAGFLDLGTMWNVETSLDESNWRAIERCVGPHAWRAFQLELLRDLETSVSRPLRAADSERREPLERLVRKRFAVVVGVSDYEDPSAGLAPHAREDAQAVAAAWALPAGGGLSPERDTLLLIDGLATRESVLAAIAQVGSRASPSDEVLVYFAGLGASVPGGEGEPTSPVLLLHDARVDELASTALSLTELTCALDALRAERVLVVADTSFAGRGGRTLARNPGATPEVSPSRAAVLLASQPDQAALVLAAEESGLFTHLFLAGLLGAADADQDADVDLLELVEFVQQEVGSRAGYQGGAQVPRLIGGVDLCWPR
jgi:Caspase domain